MKTVYKIYKADVQHNIKYKRDFEFYEGISYDVTEGYADCDNELISSFSNKEEALKELDKYESYYQITDGYYYGYVVYIKEYYVEKQEVDEDEEFLEGGDICGFSKIKEST